MINEQMRPTVTLDLEEYLKLKRQASLDEKIHLSINQRIDLIYSDRRIVGRVITRDISNLFMPEYNLETTDGIMIKMVIHLLK